MLTDADCRNVTCPAGKNRLRLTDGGGLYLEVTPTGSKRWYWKYRKGNSETRLSLGVYPIVTLKAARIARDEAREQRDAGNDPLEARKLDKMRRAVSDDATFKGVTLSWYEKQLPHWSPSHAGRVLAWLQNDLFPYIGTCAMEDITPLELLAAVQRVEDRGAGETAHRVLQMAGQVWTYWLPAAPITQRNITEGLRARLKPYRGSKFPAITDPVRLGQLLRAMREYKGGIVVKTALLLAPILYQRPGNLRQMEWSELDLDKALWTIPGAKMKRTVAEKEHGEDHVVPLPRQAVELLRGIHPLTGRGQYVFPNERQRSKCISDNSVRTALYSLGFGKEQSWHGFRATARTMLVDQLEQDPLAVEAHLAHAVKDANGRSYNRTTYLKQRARISQLWADYLQRLETGKVRKLLPLKAA